MTPKAALAHTMDRAVTIRAPRDLVFRYFTDSARWAQWWGAGSEIDARAGGQLLIRLPGGNEIAGEVVSLAPPESIAFTYGYVKGEPVPPGASLVTITLREVAQGTLVQLTHAFDDRAAMEHHVQGWRYQLSVFGNVVSNELHSAPAAVADRWFSMWSNPDAGERNRALDGLAAPDITMTDRFSAIEGVDDLRAHLDAVHRFMPGYQLQRDGEPQHCQGRILAQWKAADGSGTVRGSGTNVFVMTADGRVESVTGFWRS
jgi:uncharacterized protein YndB with AHSA1/START domain